ncbi:hypothetical protein [Acinetobacter shaoyimingii]|uniref:Bacteriocin n=1 Tax=Acinetobacter shaoyimingii TaxID=2715164 RepID=A0A6G8RYQ5_9GAMM|nr:hypothetical protein [Acinetobacter shaoyimingii]QIO07001.1 hypothetical protein G8E00_14195 [Acinetobacter shaoyimingii]
MKNNLVELNQDEIQTVSGAGRVSDFVGDLGERYNFGRNAENRIIKASDTTQDVLNKVGLPLVSNLIKFIL